MYFGLIVALVFLEPTQFARPHRVHNRCVLTTHTVVLTKRFFNLCEVDAVDLFTSGGRLHWRSLIRHSNTLQEIRSGLPCLRMPTAGVPSLSRRAITRRQMFFRKAENTLELDPPEQSVPIDVIGESNENWITGLLSKMANGHTVVNIHQLLLPK
jgi:hypothetical protein